MSAAVHEMKPGYLTGVKETIDSFVKDAKNGVGHARLGVSQ